MTDLKKGKELTRPIALGRMRESARRGRASQAHLRSGAVEAFEDEWLDEALARAVERGEEPRLLLFDRLANGTRIRRES